MRFARSSWSAVRASRDIISVPGSNMKASASRAAVCVLILDLPVRRGIIQTPKLASRIDSDGWPDHDLALVFNAAEVKFDRRLYSLSSAPREFCFGAPRRISHDSSGLRLAM